MIRHLIAAAALLAPVPALAQSQQEALDARYDRALAAGYKALFLCSAIANAERAGANRTPESVMQWELTGIQAPLDGIVGELPYEIRRPDPEGQIEQVSVKWADDVLPRIADHDSQRGCRLLPIAGMQPPARATRPQSPPPSNAAVAPAAGVLATAMSAGLAGDYGEGTRTTAVLVQRDGRVLGELYAEDFGPDVPQRTWSVAKSIAATVIGAAVQRGEAEIGDSAGLGHGFTDGRSQITVDHLLRMASGRYSDTPGNRTDPLYFGGATVGERAATWPLIHAPGTVYRYANNDTLMAVKAIEDTFEQHPPAEFFARLGMYDTVAETDWQGNYILSSQVWSTARDLAALGQLYLDGGVWNGERLLPEDWAAYVSSPSGPQPDGDFGYGAGFWLFNKSEGVPTDTFAAMGNRGQYVVIVPSREVVIVRRGEDPPGSRFDIAAFTRDVLAALDN
ncbi:serine hydrolase domain-containing protein [Pelagerythrobacter rhizovicinus]|uniref:Class C beta-lactamase-related serine hydrolase n=1 Tax=Pelagerythrobacter rhizovicinus TaxID=2268576 RepID=A0A4Q2KS26_9SPHN|nr:serine hydrolase [Pelagerythrobacter rhizovicinus]RXZ66483.1 class C beta-lactamase-related serine hydrolase [Pelagerythrobacter rhizovicinus]